MSISYYPNVVVTCLAGHRGDSTLESARASDVLFTSTATTLPSLHQPAVHNRASSWGWGV